MGKFLEIFKKPATENNMPTISVPDIKSYLVKEYERVAELKAEIANLRTLLEQTHELKLEYDAALVTLDEYSKRLERAKVEIDKEKERTAKARQDADECRDMVNSYKIRFNNAAMTKEQMRDEIVDEVKASIIEKINSCKGSLSKKKVCEIIQLEG